MKYVLIALSLAGCASAPQEPIAGPNGRPLHVLRCTYTESCFSEASKFCPAGYTVVGQNEENRGGGSSIGGGFGSFGRGGGVGVGIGSGTGETQTVTVECK